ncbi:MAG: hypothetical protein Q8L48_25740 [Archangium sp.]|nr:hypothetical protein [Archangium sp.]
MNPKMVRGHSPKTAFASVLSLTYMLSDRTFRSLLARLGAPLIRRAFFAVLVVAATLSLAQAPTAPEATDASKIPDPEKVKTSAESVGRMRGALKDVLQKLEEARNTKDVVKLNCVNEKLTQIKGLLRISEQSDVQLQEAVARKETATAEHEFTKVTIARSKVEQLRAEAEQCIGQLAFRTDENLSVEVEVPDYLPPGDPSQMPPPISIDSRPPPASPTM